MAGRSLNKVMLIGNLTRDPELRYTPQGTAVATFSLATNRSWTTDTGEKKEEVEFHRSVAWNKLAELCSQLLYKGVKVYIEGRLQTRSFTGSDNAQHSITEIVVSDMMILSPKRGEESTGEAPSPVEEPVAAPVQSPVSGGDSGVKKGKKKSDKKVPDSQPTEEKVNVDDIPF